MQKFLKPTVHLSDNETTLVTAASPVFTLFLQRIYGAISDVIGRKWLPIGFGLAGMIFTIPLLTALMATTRAHLRRADRRRMDDCKRLCLDQRGGEG